MVHKPKGTFRDAREIELICLMCESYLPTRTSYKINTVRAYPHVRAATLLRISLRSPAISHIVPIQRKVYERRRWCIDICIRCLKIMLFVKYCIYARVRSYKSWEYV